MIHDVAHREDLASLEETIGYSFKNRSFLVDALTHPSFVNEDADTCVDNQRMEFLGDSVLGLVVAEKLFLRFPDAAEGKMSSGLAQIVCESALADVARAIGLGTYIRMGRGEALSGGRDRASVLADGYEALLAAVFLDRGLDEVSALVERLHGEAIDACQPAHASHDFKSRLQKLVQSAKSAPPAYRIVDETGPAHQKLFVAEVVIDGNGMARGQGRSKKEAEQSAAEAALVEYSQSPD